MWLWGQSISLLWNIDKVLERLMYNRLHKFLELNSVINDLQFGFRQKYSTSHASIRLTLFGIGFFGAAHGWGSKKPSLPKICHTHPTMMKLRTVIPYSKKIQKIYESRGTPLEFCWHQHFFTRNQQILLYQEIQI